MHLPKILGRNVRRLRVAQGASQEEIAFKSKVNRAYLSDVERGERNPTVRIVGRIARALGVEPSELFTLAGEEKLKR
jgi:transcriptional regulator with XRE-family HTH domain